MILNPTKCPFCRGARGSGNFAAAAQIGTGGPDLTQVDCNYCGRFTITGSALAMLEPESSAPPDEYAVLSHIARQETELFGRWAQFNSDRVRNVLEAPRYPAFSEQIDNVVLYVGSKTKFPGRTVGLGSPLAAFIGAVSAREAAFVVAAAKAQGLIMGGGPPDPRVMLFPDTALTLSGWERFDALGRGAGMLRRAFVAMKFGDADLDAVIRDHFKPAVARTGYHLERLDDRPQAGLIDNRLRVLLRQARFAIVDLTHDNAGAYWEAGFVEGLGRPVIYTCERAKFSQAKTHFDTQHSQTVVWSTETIDADVEQLVATIRNSVPEAVQEG